MEQVLPEQHDAHGDSGRERTLRYQLQGTGPVTFEVWQFHMYHTSHIIACMFFLAAGLLQALATQQLQASLAGTVLTCAIFAPIRHAAHRAKNQELAHL
eukprot:6211806-Pleurochrysis_carterae.AAC.4